MAKVDCDSQTPISAVLGGNYLNKEMKQVTSILVTSTLNMEMVRKLEFLSARQQTFILYLIKGKLHELSKEESVLVERLKQRQVHVNVVKEQDVNKRFKEVNI